MPQIIIDENNWRDHIGEGGILSEDHPNNGGSRRMMSLVPRPAALAGMGKFAAKPTFPLIPEAEWKSRINDMSQNGTFARMRAKAIAKKIKDQATTQYCHGNVVANGAEHARIFSRLPHVELSAGSVAGPVTNYRNVGWYIDADLDYAVEKGIASVDFVPPNQISRAGWKPGAEENAKLHRITHYWDLMTKGDGAMFARCMSLVLAGETVAAAYNWWSHVLLMVGAMYNGLGQYIIDHENSWGPQYGDDGHVGIVEGKGTPDEAYCVQQTVASLN